MLNPTTVNSRRAYSNRQHPIAEVQLFKTTEEVTTYFGDFSECIHQVKQRLCLLLKHKRATVYAFGIIFLIEADCCRQIFEIFERCTVYVLRSTILHNIFFVY